MKYQPPGPVPLTEQESVLLSGIDFNLDRLDHNATIRTLDTAHDLAVVLIQRGAIPPARWDYFVLPELNIGSSSSRKEIFESNGKSDDAIYRHGNFLGYLRYFIFGPGLTESTVRGFCKILNDDVGTSAMVMEQLKKFVRSEVRQQDLPRNKAAQEFFKLSHELSLDAYLCRVVYDAARTTR